MALSDMIPDPDQRVQFVHDFFFAAGAAMQDLRPVASTMTDEELTDELERRMRPAVGDQFYLGRAELLAVAHAIREHPDST